ncbi:NAD(P)-binding protein [Rhizodiscina lignyota]|uniref:NAD(P)-binding protein n=1 Tax=Rhizodiscina lignyota TaxID=1504668 RepID=A0A9P4M3K0_9PEZI|nr:NAD(P)-binding protein [Rhizodiscina lignyota]
MTTKPGWKDLNDYSVVKDRSAIITGGASGLGEATVTTYVQNGAYVTIADYDEERGKKLAEKLSSEGGSVSFVRCNTASWDDCVAAFKHAVNFSPSKTLDIAVLFAGHAGAAIPLVQEVIQNSPEPSIDDIPKMPNHSAIDVNLLGVYYSTYLALHYFRLSSPNQSKLKKSLVLISSIMGYIDGTYNTDYNASKFGVRAIFRSLRSQGQKVNCRVNNILPGYILTPLTKRQHQIDDPREPSKATGFVLPWAPIEYVTEGVGRCVCNENCNGRSFAILPSGVHDIDEDVETGWGGEKLAGLLEQDGFFDIPNLIPRKSQYS